MMRTRILILICCVLSIVACRKQSWDEYYGRPDSLAQPIYQVLQKKGNFVHFLKCIDKSGYKKTLSNGGYWTCIAPNDEAFEKFFKDNGISGDEGIDSVMAQKIVKYSLIYNAYRKESLTDYQQSSGPDTSIAFKRKTAYYSWVYKNGDSLILSSNANGFFVPEDNNNKYLPYFLDKFFTFKGLSAYDYNFFYPESKYTGFNIAGASVVESDIPAENGLIDIVDRVIMPLPDLDDYLNSKDQYSEFRRLLAMVVSYQSNPEITQRNYALSGQPDSVYIKYFDAGNALGLAFSPNNENYLLGGTDAQIDGYGMVVPTNDALIPYEATILQHYKTFEAAPVSVLVALLNAHLWTSGPWPSNLISSVNSSSEPPTFSLSDIVDKKVCSNGFFYGINKVQQANVFRTVYGKPFLDPNYTLITKALDQDIKFSLINPALKFTMVMISNDVLNNNGYSYNTDRDEWVYQPPGGTETGGSLSQARVNRILASSVFLTMNGEMDDLSGEGIVESWNGEYVRYKDNTLFASGNMDDGTVVRIDSTAQTFNGKVLYTTGLLTFSEVATGAHLGRLAESDPDDYSYFFKYLVKSSIWSKSDSTITGMTAGSPYTIFVPTNAAIMDAVRAGLLPGDKTTGEPDFSPSDFGDQQNVISFIQYNILNKNMVAPDGKKNGDFVTLLQTLDGVATKLKIANSVGSMQIYGMKGDVANMNVAKSNILCDMAIIHSIDKVLDFRTSSE
ncbi:fasciclin domain-containing protein [Arachidicoccus terrestris]|uniref:fasciclin domain-containing protein n=1 Tax=Arachidicoccus terrestris TaxID=2875539 RepID=UPI001CC4338D|nr:fasciclin domain-containing protein [Arachidicoccus terrestris]UAY53804.1 fasciclin domain-containing protein [Arachidicoccus terrestris]